MSSTETQLGQPDLPGGKLDGEVAVTEPFHDDQGLLWVPRVMTTGDTKIIGWEPAPEAELAATSGEDVTPDFHPIDVEAAVSIQAAKQRAADRRRSKINGESRLPKHLRPAKDREPAITPALDLGPYETEAELTDEERQRRLRQSKTQQLREQPYAKLYAAGLTPEEREKAVDRLRRHNREK